MEILINVLCVHLILLIPAGILILSANTSDHAHKFEQVLFSSLLPIVGPAITLIVHISDRIKTEKPSDRYMGQSIDEHVHRYLWPF